MSDFIILFPSDMPDGKSQRIADAMRRIFPEHTFEVSKEGPPEFDNTVLPIAGKGSAGGPEDEIEMNLVEQEVVDVVQEAFANLLNEARKWLLEDSRASKPPGRAIDRWLALIAAVLPASPMNRRGTTGHSAQEASRSAALAMAAFFHFFDNFC